MVIVVVENVHVVMQLTGFETEELELVVQMALIDPVMERDSDGEDLVDPDVSVGDDVVE